MRREDELLTCLLGLNARAAYLKQVEQILSGSSVDWQYILNKSYREKVYPLIYRGLKNLNGLVPLSVREEFKRKYYANSLSNTLVFEEAEKIIAKFSEKNIKTIAIKGVFLAEHVYKNIALRPMSDIDLLIAKDNLKEANLLLNSLGYITPDSYFDFLKNSRILPLNTLMYKKERPFKYCLHLHWHLVNTTWPLEDLVSRIDMFSVWSKVQSTKIGGVDALALCPEHLLIYLCLHAFIHSFDNLMRLSDIAMVLSSYAENLDWQRIDYFSREWGISGIVYFSLALTEELLGLKSLNSKYTGMLKPGFQKFIYSYLAKRGLRSYRMCWLAFLFLQKGFSPKLRFVKRSFLPSSLILAHNLGLPPSRIRPTHYLHRLKNLLTP
ncbi:MAG: nucleotidyltransferase family protein [Candidatus Omnitrophica bacterium]|nr:nucleotidyltransferase family protein [Candidatus Omnitrophota bacterium]